MWHPQNPGRHDNIIGLRNLKGWKTMIICREYLEDRKQFARDYCRMFDELTDTVRERNKPYLVNGMRHEMQ